METNEQFQMHPVECEKASNGLDSPAKTGGCMINGGLVALTAGSNTGLKHNWISRLDIDFLKALSWHQLQELN
ncbi:MAG: hypothetical protein NTY48_03910 [Candidatus Diapherotrites archaeon]|nr:hypothetical protein [Candidatus Diapherotrites archaeon]